MDKSQIEVFRADLNGEGLRVAVVQSRFNEPICDALRESCLAELAQLGVGVEDVFVCSVPGALEIPVVLRQLAASEQFDALIALGAVVRGATYHFEVVSEQSAGGVMQVALEFSMPVVNAILTVDTDEQAHERMNVKGAEAARVAVEMGNLAASLATLTGDDGGE